MLEFLVRLVEGFVGLLAGILPVSPFQGIALSEQLGTALGWLNWVFPVNECARIFGLWLSAAIIVAIASFIVKKGTGVIGAATGGGV